MRRISPASPMLDVYAFCNGIGNFVIASSAIQERCRKTGNDAAVLIPNFDLRFRQIVDLARGMTVVSVSPIEAATFAASAQTTFAFWGWPKEYRIDGSVEQRRPDWIGRENELESYCRFLDVSSKLVEPPKLNVSTHMFSALTLSTAARPLLVVANGAAQSWNCKRVPYWNLRNAMQNLFDKRIIGSAIAIGGEDERAFFETMIDETKAAHKGRFTNAAGSQPISVSAGIVRAADVVLTNDTAIMHVADALNRRLAVMWGWTLKTKNAPRWSRVVSFVNADDGGCEIFPCYGTRRQQECRSRGVVVPCMETIRSARIVACVKEILNVAH